MSIWTFRVKKKRKEKRFESYHTMRYRKMDEKSFKAKRERTNKRKNKALAVTFAYRRMCVRVFGLYGLRFHTNYIVGAIRMRST